MWSRRLHCYEPRMAKRLIFGNVAASILALATEALKKTRGHETVSLESAGISNCGANHSLKPSGDRDRRGLPLHLWKKGWVGVS